MTIALRAGIPADTGAIHSLIADNVQSGHLLPRTADDIELHAGRFVVALQEEHLIGCGELAPLSDAVAEVRSLVVAEAARGHRTGVALVHAIADRARSLGFHSLCAFTHDPGHFVRLGFSIVPHAWVPEKIAHDCAGCALFRRCGQYAVSLPLRQGAGLRRPDAPAVVRVMPAPRASVERLRLVEDAAEPLRERVPA